MNGTGSGRAKVDRDLFFNPLYDAVQIALLALRIPQQFTGKSRQWHAAQERYRTHLKKSYFSSKPSKNAGADDVPRPFLRRLDVPKRDKLSPDR